MFTMFITPRRLPISRVALTTALSSLVSSSTRYQSSAAAEENNDVESSLSSSTHQQNKNNSSSIIEQQTTATTFCVLCDEPVTNWQTHASNNRHIARFAVAQELCAPERNAAMLAQLWDHIRLDFGAVDAASEQRVRRRRRRLSSTTKYLRDVHVLQDCLLFEKVFLESSSNNNNEPAAAGVNNSDSAEQKKSDDPPLTIIERVFFDQEGNERPTQEVEKILTNDIFTVAPSFSKLVHVGERAARAELLDRCSRLFPASAATEIESIVALIMSPLSMATAFDILDIKDVVYTRFKENASIALPTTKDQETLHLVALPDQTKRQVLLAILGELSLWNTRDRPQSVGSKKDADTIVTHVLALHVVENVLSELLHHAIQKVVDETTPVWREFKDDMSKLVMTSNRPTIRISKEKQKQEQQQQQKKMTGLDALNFMKRGEQNATAGENDNTSEEQINNNNNTEIFTFSSIIENLGEAPPQPKLMWRPMQLEGLLASSVPKPAKPNALFALMKPALSPKPKVSMPQQPISPPTLKMQHQHPIPSTSSSSPQQQQKQQTTSTTTTTTVSTEELVTREQKQKEAESAKISMQQELQQKERERKAKEMEAQQKMREQRQREMQQQQQQATSRPSSSPTGGPKPIPEVKSDIKKPIPTMTQAPIPKKPLVMNSAPGQGRTGVGLGGGGRPNAPLPPRPKIVMAKQQDLNRPLRLKPVTHPPKPK